MKKSKISKSGKSLTFVDDNLGLCYIKLTKLAIFLKEEMAPTYDDTVILVSKDDLYVENNWTRIDKYQYVIFPNLNKLTWEESNVIKKNWMKSLNNKN